MPRKKHPKKAAACTTREEFTNDVVEPDHEWFNVFKRCEFFRRLATISSCIQDLTLGLKLTTLEKRLFVLEKEGSRKNEEICRRIRNVLTFSCNLDASRVSFFFFFDL
jgi:hypothetical protein